MSEKEDKIVLTLGEEKVEEELIQEETKEETAEKDHATVPVSDVVGYAKLDDSSLSEEEKKMVDEFSKQIDINETNTILQYGATAQNKVADFSDTALKNVKTKDIDTVLVVGLPLRRGTSLYDCAAVIYRGNILGIVPKAYVKN